MDQVESQDEENRAGKAARPSPDAIGRLGLGPVLFAQIGPYADTREVYSNKKGLT